eukprot:INCI13110.2.p1 GENE.INCI13110.2~~INCI13110.2.p1  ORF type:complete len:441 (+),score=118.45 INCI13110.2:185-1507(+)
MSGDLELQDWEVGFSAAKPPLHDECVKKGHALRKKAEEHLKSVSKISSFARNVKFDHACQLYEDAATQFKLARQWEEAAECYKDCAYLQTIMKKGIDAAIFYQKTADLFMRCNLYDAVLNYKRCVHWFAQEGRFDIALRYQAKIAEMYYMDEDYDMAAEHFDRAALYCTEVHGEEHVYQYCYKTATCVSFIYDYEVGMEEFERCAKSCLMTNLKSAEASRFLFRAGLCAILQLEEDDAFFDKADEYLHKLKLIDVHVFPGSIFLKFLEDLLQAYSDLDINSFADFCFDMDNAVRFDFWELTMLRRIKRGLQLDMGNAPESDDDEDEFLDGETNPLRKKFAAALEADDEMEDVPDDELDEVNRMARQMAEDQAEAKAAYDKTEADMKAAFESGDAGEGMKKAMEVAGAKLKNMFNIKDKKKSIALKAHESMLAQQNADLNW